MEKVCPVVLRNPHEILAFQHPLAGLQFVKGGIEDVETPAQAAVRELHEESGLTLHAEYDLGQRTDIVEGQTWHFWLMESATACDHWRHATADDDGQTFAFFWLPLRKDLPSGFAAPYVRAHNHILQTLT